ncbi:MAG TPA: YceH family protein [Acidobacteriaceae bacterium]|jgi:hypothetical protein|nr:YceH family protein [Acidobacteriaceae bacterium]
MPILLTPVEARVLGALIEKETTTPEYYPLSLNALVNACNQKNNREPVMQLGEDEVRQALHGLEDDGLAGVSRGHDSRVSKYEHHLQEVFNFTRGETAILCVLLLRGPQTPGELRSRTERIFLFEHIDDVLSTLDKLTQRDPALAAALPRQPGSREIRYTHLLSGELDTSPPQAVDESSAPAPGASDRERLLRLENEVANLRQEVTDMKSATADLQRTSHEERRGF